jgi:hypothetical protein
LRWTFPPIAGQANAYAGLFHDDAAFEAMPASLTQRLDEEQRSVLRGISSSTKAVHVVDALAGTGKSQLARCLINRWGSLRDNGQGFLMMTLRTRILRTELLESLLLDKAVVLNKIINLLILSPPSPRASLRRSRLSPPRSSFVIRQVISPDQIMFSGRLPDHLLQAGTLLDEAAAFEAIVEEKEPLKSVLTQLQSDKLDLTNALDTTPTGAWECLAHLDPSGSSLEFGDTLKRKAALAMNTLWEAFLAWKSAEETTIATIKVLCCTVDVALKGVAGQANYPANLLFRHNKPRAVIMDELQRKSPS